MILRIMTFNIRGALYDDGSNSWPHRAALNAQIILRHAPDLIGFQELHLANLVYYKEHLPGYAHVLGTPYNDEEPYQYPTIFWNEKRLSLIESGGFWLSETPDRHSPSWGTDCIRSATWARLKWLEASLTFTHLNTHLDHVSEMARTEGTRLILRHLDSPSHSGMPLILTGDFNCIPGSATYRLLIEHGFVDTFETSEVFQTSDLPSSLPVDFGSLTRRLWTYHGFRGRDHTPWAQNADRIDWILIRDWEPDYQVERCSIVEDAEPPLYPSDHYPVVAEISNSFIQN